MFGGQQESLESTINAAREGQVLEAEDLEQQQYYEKLIDILLAGGYFRARITGLSEFDKVVGGLAWAITASQMEVDVDVFYQDNLDIGQKIKVGESIIKSLLRMKCPHRLSPNQLTGHIPDYINIFPVVQWLITKVIETREEFGDQMRLFSESQFSKTYKAPEDTAFEQRKTKSTQFVGAIKDKYKPTRKFKRNKGESPSVQATLLEYGQIYKASRNQPELKRTQSANAQKIEASLGKGKGEGGSSAEELAKQEQAKQDRIMGKMTQLDESGNSISASKLDSFISSSEIDELSSDYQKNRENEDALQGGAMQGEKLHKLKKSSLEKQIAQKQEELEKLESEYETQNETTQEVVARLGQVIAFNERVISESAKLDELETDENTKQLQALKRLIALNENLKLQEKLFRNNCKNQMAQLKEMILKLKDENADNEDGTPDSRPAIIAETFAKDSAKLKKIEQLSAKKTRDIQMVERKIDEIPSRAELTQYQRYFLELYEQVSSKLTETRQYFIVYNTLEEKRNFLAKEVSILNSINDNYKSVMKSKSNKEKMLESMQQILQGISANLEQYTDKKKREKIENDTLNEKHLKFVEKERMYFGDIKDFQEECKKNEALVAKLQEIS